MVARQRRHWSRWVHTASPPPGQEAITSAIDKAKNAARYEEGAVKKPRPGNGISLRSERASFGRPALAEAATA